MEKSKRKEIIIRGKNKGVVFISKTIYNESQKIIGGKNGK